MSVLNDMLRNLEARGAGSAPAAIVAQPLPPAVAPRSRRPAIWAAAAGVALLAAAGFYWSEQRPTQPGANAQRAAAAVEPATPMAVGAVVEVAAAAVASPAEAAPIAAAVAQPAVASPAVASPAVAQPAVPSPAEAAPIAAALAATAPLRPTLPIETAALAPQPPASSTGAARAPQTDRVPPRTLPAVRPAAAAAAPTGQTPASVAEVRPSSASRSDPQAELARAADLIARGRNSEAMPLLERILAAHPRQANARQALATLQFETGQPLRSLATLLEGAAIDAGFAVPAAQLQAALGDVAGALATLERVPAAARTPVQHALHGGLAHRLGRHALAVDSYRQALRSPQAEAVWWLGLGLAHEGAAAQPEAARAALKQALAQTSLAPEPRSFAQQRLLAIRAGDARVESVAAAAR